MGDQAPTAFVTNCVDHDGAPRSATVTVLDDGRMELSIKPMSPAVFTPEEVADLRNKLGAALTAALQGVTWSVCQ
jgi:hypothetical protein